MLLYSFCVFVLQKMGENGENTSFLPNLIEVEKSAGNGVFFPFFIIFCKTNPQNVLSNIWFLWYETNFTKNFWSHGTPLGYLGAGSQEAPGLGACRFQILVIWGPNDPPVLVVSHGDAKNPNTVGSWCGWKVASFSGWHDSSGCKVASRVVDLNRYK